MKGEDRVIVPVVDEPNARSVAVPLPEDGAVDTNVLIVFGEVTDCRFVAVPSKLFQAST
jgi:hypothetical protein